MLKKAFKYSCLSLVMAGLVLQPIAVSMANPATSYSTFGELKNEPSSKVSYQAPPEQQPEQNQLNQNVQGVAHTQPEIAANLFIGEELINKAREEGIIQLLLNGLLYPLIRQLATAFLPGFMLSAEERKLRMESSREDGLNNEDYLNEEMDTLRHATIRDAAEQMNDFQDQEREYARSKVRALSFIEDGTASEMCELSSGRRNFSSGWGVATVSMAAMGASFGADNNDDSPVEEVKEKLPHALFYMGRGDYGGNIPDEVKEAVEEEYEQEVQNQVDVAGEGPARFDGCDLRNDIDFTNFYNTINDVETPCYYEERDEDGNVITVESIQTGTEKRMSKIAFFRNTFPNAYTQIPEETFENNFYTPADTNTPRLTTNLQQFVLDKRTVDAFRSIAQNTFIHLINRRTPAPAPASDDQQTIFDKQMASFGFDEDDPILDTPFGQRLQEYKTDPSYEAQLEFMAKYQYFLPDYLADTTDELGKNKVVLTNATESIVLYDALQSSLRQEAIMATILEIFLENKISNVESLATSISSSQ